MSPSAGRSQLRRPLTGMVERLGEWAAAADSAGAAAGSSAATQQQPGQGVRAGIAAASNAAVAEYLDNPSVRLPALAAMGVAYKSRDPAALRLFE